ncbi:hypothetical protein [Rhodovulum sp. MB263]|uniref:hypothetical protein n=1 Tax=Rhodovulum sp. (strain MB263) TaxID=308754 RepID=UPI0012DB2E9A|nr:hypothetical protein [Rhodovulum sp. MB263]
MTEALSSILLAITLSGGRCFGRPAQLSRPVKRGIGIRRRDQCLAGREIGRIGPFGPG